MPNIIDPRPSGTLEALKSLRRDPMAYGSCAEPDPRAGKNAVMGCSAWHKCPWKGQHPSKASRPDVLDGQVGPANKGTQLLKQIISGPAMRNAIMPCFDFIPMRETALANGASMDVIAEEGEQIELAGTIKVPADPLKGIANEYWRDFEGVEGMKVVPKFPRIEDQPKLKMAVKMEARRKQIEAEEEANRRRGHLGMAQVILSPTEGLSEANQEATGAGGIGHEESSSGAEIHSDLGLPQEGTEGSNPDKPTGRKRPRYGAD